jgi:glycosyltransferase involved in cell wall biosynthesis
MKVAIDTGPLSSGHSVRGIGVHTRELVNELKKLGTKELEIDTVDFSKTDLSKYDLAHFTSFKPFNFSIPFSKVCRKMILTIHDLIPLIYPGAYPPGIKGSFRFAIQKILLKNFDAIITISETSRKDICRFLPVEPEKVCVIHLAPREIFRKITNSSLLRSSEEKYKLPEKFVLYVNDVNYNKNLITLADACKLLKMPLVVVGKQAADVNVDFNNVENEPFEKFLEKYGDSRSVLRLGFVSDEDLVALYNLAAVFCVSSFYEGFSLQILEAMASGCPVVASKIQAHVEIADNAVLFADPKDREDFAKKIKDVVNNKKLRKSLIAKGFKKAKEYSWVKTASETLRVYKKAFQKQ